MWFHQMMGTGSGEEDSSLKTTRVSEKGQTTIPKELRDELGVEPGDEVEWYRTSDGLIVRTHIDSGRGVLLEDEDEETRRAVFEDLVEKTREDRNSASWNVGR
jgi:AbrB family looped-hinge helix DNA binding protein